MTVATQTKPLAYTVAQAAELIGISPWSYYDRLKRGEVPGRRMGPGRTIIVPRTHLERFIETGDWRAP